MSDFLDPSEEIKKHGSKLPHWQQDGVMQFVTFRLGDSLPQTQLAEWMESRKIFLEQNPKPWMGSGWGQSPLSHIFRVGDSLPASKLTEWRERSKTFLKQNP